MEPSNEVVEIGFRADAGAIRNALEVVGVVTPQGVTEQGQSGYLFVVGKKVRKNADGTPGADDGKDFCWVYSHDPMRAARAEFPIYDVKGEGAFVYLADKCKAFDHVDGDLSFEIRNDPPNNSYKVQWGFGPGASTEWATFDPRLGYSLDKRLNEAVAAGQYTYPTQMLKEALQFSKEFLVGESDRNAKDEYKIINIYDATSKGDGVLHATDGYQRIYFQCDEFKGKGMQIHSQHIGLLESFLAKMGPTTVICTGSDKTYAMNQDGTRVLGWSKHTKPPLEYKVLPKSWDNVVLHIQNREVLLKQLRLLESLLGKGHDKIQVRYEAEPKQLRFYIASGAKTTSLPIDVQPAADTKENTSYSYDVNINQLIRLFKDVKSNVVEFRMFRTEEHGAPPGAGFRTVDDFWMTPEGKVVGGNSVSTPPPGGIQCKVTRFMPSKK